SAGAVRVGFRDGRGAAKGSVSSTATNVSSQRGHRTVKPSAPASTCDAPRHAVHRTTAEPMLSLQLNQQLLCPTTLLYLLQPHSEDVAYFGHLLAGNLVDGVGELVPVRIVEIDEIDGRDAGAV